MEISQNIMINNTFMTENLENALFFKNNHINYLECESSFLQFINGCVQIDTLILLVSNNWCDVNYQNLDKLKINYLKLFYMKSSYEFIPLLQNLQCDCIDISLKYDLK